jgi:hypothetical protein
MSFNPNELRELVNLLGESTCGDNSRMKAALQQLTLAQGKQGCAIALLQIVAGELPAGISVDANVRFIFNHLKFIFLEFFTRRTFFNAI